MSQEAMNPQTARKLLEVGEAFRIPGPFFSYEEIKMGNVNHTYKVNYIRDDGTGMAKVKSYLVQRVNTYAFQRPVELMKNIDGVTGHIRQKHPGAQYLHFHHTQDGCNYLFDEDGFWRLSNYVPSVTYDSCDDLGVVRSAGEAFGSFQMMLSDFDASSLYYTIPDFHNTRKRYAKLREDMESDPCGRVGAVKAELDWLLSVEERACALTDPGSGRPRFRRRDSLCGEFRRGGFPARGQGGRKPERLLGVCRGLPQGNRRHADPAGGGDARPELLCAGLRAGDALFG